MSVTTHTLKIEVDPSWISDFNKNRMKLCCAFFVRKGAQEYRNVVAGAFGVQQNMSITWVDKYAIAATTANYKARDKVAGGTTEVEIERAQSITVAPDGTPTTVTPDDKVAKDAFRFIHMDSSAAAVVYMTVADSQVPIYITNGHPDPPGQQDLSPKAKIKIWFDDQTEAKDYFDDISNLTHDVNMEGKKEATVQYTREGKWTNKQPAIMITTYRLTVEIDPHWVAHFRRTKFNICTSFGFKSNYIDMDYSVIATASDPTPLNTITWKDEFTYAACKDSPQLNCPVFESTKPVPVLPNERLVIQNDWTVGSIGWDERAPKNGILFVNDTAATSLIFKTVDNRADVPVYVSSTGGTTPPCGQHTLVPTGKVMVFFMAQEQRTVFSKDRVNTRVIEIPYADKPTMTVFYNKDGLWEMKGVPKNVDTKL